MRRNIKKVTNFFDRLSMNFNRMMGIPEGIFGSARKSNMPGPGKARAIARLAAHRAAQAERLKDAPDPQETRQQRRAFKRRNDKRFTMTASQNAFFNMKLDMPKYPRTTFFNGR